MHQIKNGLSYSVIDDEGLGQTCLIVMSVDNDRLTLTLYGDISIADEGFSPGVADAENGVVAVGPERDANAGDFAALDRQPDRYSNSATLCCGGPRKMILQRAVRRGRNLGEPKARDSDAQGAHLHRGYMISITERRARGGGLLGTIGKQHYDKMGTLTVAYCYDREGNYIEVQNWSP